MAGPVGISCWGPDLAPHRGDFAAESSFSRKVQSHAMHACILLAAWRLPGGHASMHACLSQSFFLLKPLRSIDRETETVNLLLILSQRSHFF
jgi:hypothetical protein